MKSLSVEEIHEYISQIPFVKRIDLDRRDYLVCGKVEIDFDELEEPLEFEIEIYPQYPLQSYGSETIKFINKDLLDFNHVMENGSICIHTAHDLSLKKKLEKDFSSLKNWILKYFVDKAGDSNYEHILVPEKSRNDSYDAFLFTEIDYAFTKGEVGEVKLSRLNPGLYKDKPIFNQIVQGFKFPSGEVYASKWSERYRNSTVTDTGLFAFVESAPAHRGRFAFKNWADFGDLMNQEVLAFLHNFEKRTVATQKGKTIPLFIGYRTVLSEIHWQVAVLEIGTFPLVGVPEKRNGRKTGRWNSNLTDAEVSWALSRNCSYEYFFGRGTLAKELIDKKVLILGIGAIGSIVATTLVRGGCKFLDLADYDVKEPENVCRSEYFFDSGLSDKITELTTILTSISPFVEIATFKRDCFENLIKVFHKERVAKETFESELNEYDLIFDCTTDNDLMYILDSLDLNCDLVNLSITNHAKDLVCAFHPNIYRFVINQYTKILENDLDDLYNPTGCWSPTFRASYNDINVLVQTAIKHINLLYQKGQSKNDFVLRTAADSPFKIETQEY